MTALAIIATVLHGAVVTGELLLLAFVSASLVVAYHSSPLASRPAGRRASPWPVWLGAFGAAVLVAAFGIRVPGTIGWPGWLSLLSGALALGAGLCTGEWISRRRGHARSRRPPGVTAPSSGRNRPPPAAGRADPDGGGHRHVRRQRRTTVHPL